MVQDCLAFILNYGHILILKTVKTLHLKNHKNAFQPISPNYFLTPSKKIRRIITEHIICITFFTYVQDRSCNSLRNIINKK